MIRSYECTVIFAPGGADEELKAHSHRYVSVIAENGGDITGLETWGKRRLAYEIEDRFEGYYYFYRFRSTNAAIVELGRQMRIDEGILRHMIVKDDLATGNEPKLDPAGVEAVLKREEA